MNDERIGSFLVGNEKLLDKIKFIIRIRVIGHYWISNNEMENRVMRAYLKGC